MRLEAEKKIKDEMEKEKSSYVQVVGNFLLEQINKNPEAVIKITAEENKDKTILKSLAEMRKVAEKKKTGNYTILTDEEGFKIVLEYYGIKEDRPGRIPETEAKREIDFDISLDDLL